MQALIKFNVIITLAALSLSGSSAWAADENSFVAKAELGSFKVIPPIFSDRTGDITLTFEKPTPTTGETLVPAQKRKRNRARIKTKAPGDQAFGVQNIRLYFGQRFANGLPIAALCDDDVDTLNALECIDTGPEDPDPEVQDDQKTIENEFELSDIQFQRQQWLSPISIGTFSGRLSNSEIGFMRIKDLIKGGLIYVVINSKYDAKLDPNPSDQDPETDDVIYIPPAPDPEGGIIIDGELRGTLSLVE